MFGHLACRVAAQQSEPSPPASRSCRGSSRPPSPRQASASELGNRTRHTSPVPSSTNEGDRSTRADGLRLPPGSATVSSRANPVLQRTRYRSPLNTHVRRRPIPCDTSASLRARASAPVHCAQETRREGTGHRPRRRVPVTSHIDLSAAVQFPPPYTLLPGSGPRTWRHVPQLRFRTRREGAPSNLPLQRTHCVRR